ncbi:MAG TPA: hypothetical protein VKB59_02815 [Micromonosporaceae bacterium]|nr:hypothetical protein [Micromonosporaceae bacterium]
MIDYDVLVEDLRSIAESAPSGPPNLAEVVAGRYVRRRRTRAATSVAAGVVAIAVGMAVTMPLISATHTPTPGGSTLTSPSVPIPAGPGPWHLPAAGATLPPLSSAFPGAVIDLSTRPPDGAVPFALATIDQTHVLVSSGSTAATTDALYSFDTVAGTYRLISTVPRLGGAPTVSRWAATAHRIVWDVDAPGGFDVYTAPVSGGPPQQIAHVGRPVAETGPWYATDDAVYWSGSDRGVVRLNLNGGTPTPLPGFADMYVLHGTSPWAVRLADVHGSPYDTGLGPLDVLGRSGVARQLKNLVTGATIDVSAPAGVRALSCAAVFCVGTVADGATITDFIQRPDGSDRVTLPGGDVRMAYPVANRGLLVSAPDAGSGRPGAGGRTSWLIVDPTAGSAGQSIGGASTAYDDGAFGTSADSGGDIAQFFVIGLAF